MQLAAATDAARRSTPIEKILPMRTLVVFFAATTALAQSAPQVQLSQTTESLRGVSAVSQNVAWASGAHGTYLRSTDAGRTWIPAQLPDAAALDFRAVVAFSASEAFLMSSGPGDQSRIYHTTDAGQHWKLQFTNTNPKGFFDSMVFWDSTHGIVLGDPIPDETGKLKFELLITGNGQTWTQLPSAQLPPAADGEGAFAASNSCVAILPNRIVSPDRIVIPGEARDPGVAGTAPHSAPAAPPARPWKSGASAPRQPSENEGASAPDPNIWFATGGTVARVFHSSDRGQTWQVFDTPILHGSDSTGIFSIAFRDPTHGVIAGGDYKHPDQDGPNLAFTNDAGKTWTLSHTFPHSYYSAVTYDRQNDESHERLFIVGSKFIYDFRPPKKPTRISPNKKSSAQFNAVSPYPTGGAIFAGPKGVIATIP
jgi:photosystem II stability/assembly factor-like uncharacterized protein